MEKPDMQKRSLLKLAILMASPLPLVACGDKSTEQAPAASSGSAASATAPTAAQQGPLKIAFVYISPVSEEGWSSRHDQARRELEAHFGSKIEVKAIDNVPDNADAERVLRDLCQQGNKLIFATSFGYMNGVHKVAKEFPNVKFEHCTGYKTAENIGVYAGRFYEGRYLAGMLAAMSTKSNKLGYVAAFPIPEVLQGINAFTLGARAVNPNAEIRIVWTSSWYDPGKESDAVVSLKGQGCDVVTHHTDSAAVALAAEKNQIRVVAYNTSMPKAAPTAQLAASVPVWTPFYIERVNQVMEGRWKAENVWGGIADGMVDLIEIAKDVPTDVKTKVEEARQKLLKREMNVFTGPFKTNDGREVCAAGKTLTDAELLSMDYLLEGVVGKLPQAGK